MTAEVLLGQHNTLNALQNSLQFKRSLRNNLKRPKQDIWQRKLEKARFVLVNLGGIPDSINVLVAIFHTSEGCDNVLHLFSL